MDVRTTLTQLGIAEVNDGSYAGLWRAEAGARTIESINPASGTTIARVRVSTQTDYDAVIAAAQAAFAQWRLWPAPKRGELVRRVAELLRQHQDALGTLVALENGKIKSEGDGEVQEMIDIAEFAVGQSRMLYGLSM